MNRQAIILSYTCHVTRQSPTYNTHDEIPDTEGIIGVSVKFSLKQQA